MCSCFFLPWEAWLSLSRQYPVGILFAGLLWFSSLSLPPTPHWGAWCLQCRRVYLLVFGFHVGPPHGGCCDESRFWLWRLWDFAVVLSLVLRGRLGCPTPILWLPLPTPPHPLPSTPYIRLSCHFGLILLVFLCFHAIFNPSGLCRLSSLVWGTRSLASASAVTPPLRKRPPLLGGGLVWVS